MFLMLRKININYFDKTSINLKDLVMKNVINVSHRATVQIPNGPV